jgi:hypothetical protein
VTEEEGWWTIREVLDERVGKAGQAEYLVQWEDEIHTGESFPPSWVCSSAVLLICWRIILTAYRLKK